MKISQMLLLVAVVFTACKKREEVTPMPSPDPLNMKIVEIVDSGATVDTRRFFYDDLGRITRLEYLSSLSEFNTTFLYEYSGGMLSRIVSESPHYPESNFTMQIIRNNEGLVTSTTRLSKQGALQGKVGYFYDGEGNLVFRTNKIEQATDSTSTQVVDTTFYSDFIDHRWSRSLHTTNFKFSVEEKKKRITQTFRGFDSESRLVRSNYASRLYLVDSLDNKEVLTLETKDSTTMENYFGAMSDLQKALNEKNKARIRDYYSPNMDVYEAINVGPIDPYVFITYDYVSTFGDDLVFKTESFVKKSNHYGLPTQMLISSSTYRVSKRTIRYEVD